MHKLGKLETKVDAHKVIIERSALKVGINNINDHIIKLDDSLQVEFVIDKVCDHAGGRLILKGNEAICPMHNWKLDLSSLQYNNSHVCKKKKDFIVNEDASIEFDSSKRSLVNPFKSSEKGDVSVRWLNHACLYIECNGKSLITDPWLLGPAFLTGWWLAKTSPSESVELLKSADFIYISHNHPDHLHAETLALVPRDKPIITANFHSSSSKVMLEKLGFENIIVPDFYDVLEIAPQFQLSILKSGDFRDDSGIYISVNGHEFLLAVDSNFLNSHILPQKIDLFLTSFAGGASGFPLCYQNFTEEEKTKIIKRSRNSIRAKVIDYVNACLPTYFMPYAGMFAEYANRDSYILDRNYKIETSEYESLLKDKETNVLIPDSSKILNFSHNGLEITEAKNNDNFRKEDRNFYIENLKKEYPYNAARIVEYLKKSGYQENQILQIIPTNDDFEDIIGDIIYADFSSASFTLIDEDELISSKDKFRVMQMRVRAEIIMCTVENYLPWEDLLIGFQMRAIRSPNDYESGFWYHFTNVYVAKENFKYSSYCGACTIVEQNPIWI